MRTIKTQRTFEKWLDDQPIAAPLALPFSDPELSGLAFAALEDLPPPIEAEIKLGIGTFEVDSPLPRYLDLTGTHVWYSKILCHQPIRLAHTSSVSKLYMRAAGNNACLNIDIAAYSNIWNVWFGNTLPFQSHLDFDKNDVSTIEVQGTAIEATKEHDGDNSYAVKVTECKSQFNEFGINIAASAVNHKGLLQLAIQRCWFNATRYPFRGIRVGECEISGGLYQLALEGIALDGNGNKVSVHFERGDPNGFDIHILPGSHGRSFKNQLLWNDPVAARIWDEGEKTIIRYGGNRNMANDGLGPGKVKKRARR